MTTRFLTNIVKPWDELNSLLSERYAFQPEISDITRLAGSLSVSIKHQAEVAGISRRKTDDESYENRLMSDVADAWKHGELKDPRRNNSLSVGSQFECNEGNNFRFIRNIVTVNHATDGSLDFMKISKEAIKYWINKLCMSINWNPSILEGDMEFHKEAYLFFNPKYQISMGSTNLQIVKRNNTNQLIPYDSPEIRFAVYEHQE